MPMQPRPMADTVGPWRPRVRRGKSVFIAVSIAGKGALHVSPRAGRALADCSPILARSSMGSSYPAPWTPRTRIIAWHIHREFGHAGQRFQRDSGARGVLRPAGRTGRPGCPKHARARPQRDLRARPGPDPRRRPLRTAALGLPPEPVRGRAGPQARAARPRGLRLRPPDLPRGVHTLPAPSPAPPGPAPAAPPRPPPRHRPNSKTVGKEK